MSLMPEPGNTILVRRLLNENRWPLIAGKMASIDVLLFNTYIVISSICWL